MSSKYNIWRDQQTRLDNEYYTCLQLIQFQDNILNLASTLSKTLLW